MRPPRTGWTETAVGRALETVEVLEPWDPVGDDYRPASDSRGSGSDRWRGPGPAPRSATERTGRARDR